MDRNVDVVFQLSKIVRAVMRMHGKVHVFNNIYDTGTRTVKCYDREGSELEMDVRNTLQNLPFQFKYRIRRTKGSRYGAPGFIVKLYS